MKKINIFVPNHVQPFEFFFADEIFELLAPIPEAPESFLQDVARAILKSIDSCDVNQFYIHRIISQQPDEYNKATHKLLLADAQANKIEPNFAINMSNKISAGRITSEDNVEFSAEKHGQNIEFLGRLCVIIKANEQHFKAEALENFHHGKIAVPPPFKVPFQQLSATTSVEDDAAIRIEFDPKKASEIFSIDRARTETMKHKFQCRMQWLDLLTATLNQHRIRLEELLNDAKQPATSYDTQKLIMFANLLADRIVLLMTAVEEKITTEKKRISQTPAHTLLESLAEAKFDVQNIENHNLLQTIYRNFVLHEYYATPLRLIKKALIWAIKEASRQYYEEFRKEGSDPTIVHAELSRFGNLNKESLVSRVQKKLVSANECKEYLETKRANFNNKFACVAIQITIYGQLVYHIEVPAGKDTPAKLIHFEDLIQNNGLPQIQELLRTLMSKCNTSTIGSSSALDILSKCLIAFNSIISKVNFSDVRTEFTKSSSAELKEFIPPDSLLNEEKMGGSLYTYEDVKFSYNPLSLNNLYALKNTGGNVQFTWQPSLLNDIKNLADKQQKLITAIAGNLEQEGLLDLLINDIIRNENASREMSCAENYLTLIERALHDFSHEITTYKAILRQQHQGVKFAELIQKSSARLDSISESANTEARQHEKLNLDTHIKNVLKCLNVNIQTLKNNSLISRSQTNDYAECIAADSNLAIADAIKIKTESLLGNVQAAQKKVHRHVRTIDDNILNAKIVERVEKDPNPVITLTTKDNIERNLYLITAGYKSLEENLHLATTNFHAMTIIKTYIEEESFLNAEILRAEQALINMSYSYGNLSLPPEVSNLSHVIKITKNSVQSILETIQQHIRGLEINLTNKANHEADIINFNVIASNELAALKQQTQNLSKVMFDTQLAFTVAKNTNQMYVSACDLIIATLKNLNYWSQQVGIKGEPVKDDDGKIYYVPKTISDLYHAYKTSNYLNYSENVGMAEALYSELRKIVPAGRPHSFFASYRADTTDHFYTAIRTKEPDKLKALDTWKNNNPSAFASNLILNSHKS